MIPERPGMLAEPNHHHLEQAAFDRPVIAGVRLDAGDDADVIGLGRVAIEHDRKAFAGVADRHDLHRGHDRRADKGLGDAVAFEHLPLSLRGAATVAAHGRDQKRLGSEVLEEANDAFEDERNIGDPAAAGREGDALSRPDGPAQVELLELSPNRAGDILDARPLKVLTNPEHVGITHDQWCLR